MSVSPLASSLFGSAVSLLSRPSTQLSGFSLDGSKATQPAAPPPRRADPLHHDTQAALLALQQQPHRAGAFADGLEQVVNGRG